MTYAEHAAPSAEGGWIRCSERMPEPGAEVLAHFMAGGFEVVVWNPIIRGWYGDQDSWPVASMDMWMPIPPTPTPKETTT